MDINLLEQLRKSENTGLDERARANGLVGILNNYIKGKDQKQSTISMITFYSFIKEGYSKGIVDFYKNSFSTIVSGYYNKVNIEKDIEEIAANEELLSNIIELAGEKLIDVLAKTVYEKSKIEKKYENTIQFMKEECKNFGIISNELINVDSSLSKNSSEKIENILELVNDTKKIVEEKPIIDNEYFINKRIDNGVQEQTDSAMKKINELAEKNIENKNLEEHDIKSIDTSLFDGPIVTSSSSYQYQKEALINKQKKLDMAEKNRVEAVFSDAAAEIGSSEKELKHAIEKKGIDSTKIDEIVMPDSMKVEEPVRFTTIPHTRLNTLIENLFIKTKLRTLDMVIDEIDDKKVMRVNENMTFNKIANCEHLVLDMMKKSCQRKAKYAKLAENSKNTIDKIRNKRIMVGKSMKEKVSDNLISVANKISPIKSKKEIEISDLKINQVIGKEGTKIISIPTIEENVIKM